MMEKIEKTLDTEQSVLNRIGAKNFRSISKEQIISFVTAIPEMDKEVAIKCVEQFPKFADSAVQMIQQLNNACDAIVQENGKKVDKTIDSYRLVLDTLSEQLKEPKIRKKEKEKIIDSMIDVADKIADVNRENQSFLKHVLSTIAAAVGGVATLSAALLGVKFLKRD